jgi:hypothetical protein
MANDEIVKRILAIVNARVNPRQELINLKKTQDIIPGIMKIIKNDLGQAPAVVTHAPMNDVKASILLLVKERVKLPPKVKTAINTRVNQEGNQKNKGFFKTLFGFFSPKNKMPTEGPAPKPNFVAPKVTGKNEQGRNTFNRVPPMPGYIFTTRNGKTGWYLNKPPVIPGAPVVPLVPGAPVPPVGPFQPRNYSKMALKNLLNARRKYPENREVISAAIKKLYNAELRNLRYDGRARRARRVGELLRLLPRNFDGRRNAVGLILDDIRNVRSGTNLSNLKSNLGSVPNENVRRAFEEQRKRLNRRRGSSEYNNEYRRRRPYNSGRRRQFSPRRPGESNANYNRRREEYNRNEMRHRRELRARAERGQPSYVNSGYRPSYNSGGFRRPPPVNNGFRRSNNMGGAPPAPPLPTNEQKAINNVGGAQKALNTVASVPGGATEVAKAAEALNETSGNVQQAIYIKGASPEAVTAVKTLGGPSNAVNVLSGLNTMSQKPATQVRKATTRKRKAKKTFRPRIAELNRVINAVKKQKLISLTAHNVTKTHNIHPNDEKLKKYYKMLIKANILRTPFAKIAKEAAKKRVK